MEVKKLNQSPEQIPASKSVLTLVLERYASTIGDIELEQVLDLPEILEYLGNVGACEEGTLNAILVQTEAIGDPGLPSKEQQAILHWLDDAFAYWQEHFPIEQPMASTIGHLQPLAAALALSNPAFLIPGAHSFHLMLDTMQAALVGWQSSLGRAGQTIEQEITAAADKSKGWSKEKLVNTQDIYEHLAKLTVKDRGRAQRMSQRAIEAEQGRLKVHHSKALAANMINALLAEFPVPADLGDFLKGPWYDSAQLVLLRYGASSDEWSSMSKTTHSLLSHLQNTRPESGEGDQSSDHKKRLFMVVAELPQEIRRWLFSLQHDDNGIEQAVNMVEDKLMAILKQENINVSSVEPIVREDTPVEAISEAGKARIAQLEVGQWYAGHDDKHGTLRMQLVLKIEAELQLLFTNHAGIKVKLASYPEFASALEAGTYTLLHCDSSFSRSLVRAASGTLEDTPKVKPDPAPDQAQADGEISAQPNPQENEDRERLQREYEVARQAKLERQEARKAQRAQVELEQRKKQKEKDDAFLLEQAKTQRILRQQAEARRLELDKEAAEFQRKEEYLQRKRERERTREVLLEIGSSSRALHGAENEFRLSTGTWIGFHDGNTPLLAKLAFHDRDADTYTFVNRAGEKLRELNSREFSALMDDGLIEVIQTRSTFREEVVRTQNKQNN